MHQWKTRAGLWLLLLCLAGIACCVWYGMFHMKSKDFETQATLVMEGTGKLCR